MPELMIHNSILLYKALGEGELKSMENQVITVLMKMMFSHFPSVNQASSALCV